MIQTRHKANTIIRRALTRAPVDIAPRYKTGDHCEQSTKAVKGGEGGRGGGIEATTTGSARGGRRIHERKSEWEHCAPDGRLEPRSPYPVSITISQ